MHASVVAAEVHTKEQEALLAAIGQTRRWADELLAGETVAGIAKDEGKGREGCFAELGIIGRRWLLFANCGRV